ncbi:hypothetical protein C8R43DRAFT_1005979 [Mycena crocata]|nr:hypothetical protein C8R43DRAFT_1005979 [Mycena crocata]
MATLINRELAIELLRSMGVELPPKTKLPDMELDARLSKTLDGCQYLARVVPSLTFNPAAFKAWSHTNKPVFDTIRRHNFGEASYIYDQKVTGNHNPYQLYTNPFMDMRQSLMTMGKHWDENKPKTMLADDGKTSCVFMRIVEVLEFDKETPVLVVLFRQQLRGIQPSNSMARWIQLAAEKKDMTQITATLKEQHLFLRLLQRNSERLPTSYKPKRTSLEHDFVPSFLLPVGPLNLKEVARYNSNDGCSVCGDPAKSKCSRCNVKRYCSAVCQKEDWKVHRPACTSLKGATWKTVKFLPFEIFQRLACPPGAVPVRYNRYDTVQHREMDYDVPDSDPTIPPPNTHSSSPFIVKVQLNSADVNNFADAAMPLEKKVRSGVSMLIYDRRRTIEVTVVKFDCPAAAFDPIAELVQTKGQRGLKVFCWATRSGDWTLDLCTDHLPEWQQW